MVVPRNIAEFIDHEEAHEYVAKRYALLLDKAGLSHEQLSTYQQATFWLSAVRAEYQQWIENDWVRRSRNVSCDHEETGWIVVGGDEFPNMEAAERHMELIATEDVIHYRRVFEGQYETYKVKSADETEVGA